MLDKLNSEQISEWEAYDRLEPIGEWRADYRMAFISTVIVNLARGIHGKKGGKAANVLDFMPEWDKERGTSTEPRKQSTEEMKQAMMAIVSACKNKKKRPIKRPIRKRNEHR